MRGLNKVMLIGAVARDPEMRFTPAGRPVTSFPVAVARIWNDAEGNRREELDWFNIVVWDGLAESCNARLQQDSPVYVEGRLQTRTWEDSDSQRHSRTEIMAHEVLIMAVAETAYDESAPATEHDDLFAF